MKLNFSPAAFYLELKSQLARSSGEQRKIWANTIIEKNIGLKDLSELLRGETKTATRFLWLISDIGIAAPDQLLTELPFLFELSDSLDPAIKTAFASFWHYAGVPVENEGKAIDLLFQLLQSAETNVSIKTRSIWVLLKLSQKYPELKNELTVCLKNQMNKHTKDFDKRIVKILLELDIDSIKSQS
ncbi:MAG TPA: hypothetical protein PL029_05760 [Bacteroidia bacterium]|nr:hypothetical protein [Bacteroidia bacterium]